MPDVTNPQDRKSALITGAGRGLGRHIANEFATDHHLYLGGRDLERLDELALTYPSAEPFPGELRNLEIIESAAHHIDALDVLVHNAGVIAHGLIADTEVDEWRRVFDINVFAVAELTRFLLPALRKRHGHVVIINSGAGRASGPKQSVYSASKFAVRAFADSLRAEEPAIRVTTVYPGRIDTDMQRELVSCEGGQYDADKYLQASSVARAVRHAVDLPADGQLTELVIRPHS